MATSTSVRVRGFADTAALRFTGEQIPTGQRS